MALACVRRIKNSHSHLHSSRELDLNSHIPTMLPKINLIILGDAAVGKTSLLRHIDKRDFQPSHLKTIAVECIKYEYYNAEDDRRVDVKIWDTAGQEKFRNITYQFYRQADGIVVAFDKTRE